MIKRRRFLQSGAFALTGSVITRRLPRLQAGTPQPSIREFRTLGRTGLRVSDIALGAGVAQEPSVVNHALDLGVNYVDTAEGYFRGQSERVIGEVAKKRRGDFIIATKLTVRPENTEEELLRRFHASLERLQTDRVEILMYHNPVSTEILKLPAFHGAFSKLKSDGKVRFLGLSSHEPAMNDICQFAIDDGRFDVLLLVYNFIQQKAEATLELARRKNVGVTIMKVHASEHPEQLRRVPPDERQRLQDEADRETELFRKKYGLSETEYFTAAIRWALQNKSVGCAVMSMRNLEQVAQYVGASGQKFSGGDRELLEERAALLDRDYCRHACGECEVSCPSGVAVNDVLRIDTYFTNYGQPDKALSAYRDLGARRQASPCAACPGFCNRHCHYGLQVRDRLLSAHRRLLA